MEILPIADAPSPSGSGWPAWSIWAIALLFGTAAMAASIGYYYVTKSGIMVRTRQSPKNWQVHWWNWSKRR